MFAEGSSGLVDVYLGVVYNLFWVGLGFVFTVYLRLAKSLFRICLGCV